MVLPFRERVIVVTVSSIRARRRRRCRRARGATVAAEITAASSVARDGLHTLGKAPSPRTANGLNRQRRELDATLPHTDSPGSAVSRRSLWKTCEPTTCWEPLPTIPSMIPEESGESTICAPKSRLSRSISVHAPPRDVLSERFLRYSLKNSRAVRTAKLSAPAKKPAFRVRLAPRPLIPTGCNQGASSGLAGRRQRPSRRHRTEAAGDRGGVGLGRAEGDVGTGVA